MKRLTKTGSYISNRIGRAIADYKLIENNDRILVAVSGGKDSMAMLQLMAERRKWAPVKYELIAMHVVTDHRCPGCVHVKLLTDFFDKCGVRFHFEKIKIRDNKQNASCFWCSWNRRKALFLAAKKLKCNKIAFGHHKDDIIETLLLNMFYQGEFSAMNPRQEMFKGKLTLIRPLCYVEEKYTRQYSKEADFPSQVCRCPNAAVSKRKVMKDFISKVEKDCDHVRTNLFKSMTRINSEYLQV